MHSESLLKIIYADNLTFMHSAGHWQAFKMAISLDLVTLVTYFQTWWFKLN